MAHSEWSHDDHIIELFPRYQSVKIVRAAQIAKIEANLLSREAMAISVIVNNGVEVVRVSQEFVKKHQPTPGGYLVCYADGYLSFCPAKQFEEGNVIMMESALKEPSEHD